MSLDFQPAYAFFCRYDAGDSIGADKFYNRAAYFRNPFKRLLAEDIVKNVLGNDDSMRDEVLDNLLLRSEILKELFAMEISGENNDRAGQMSAHCNLLTYVGKAR